MPLTSEPDVETNHIIVTAEYDSAIADSEGINDQFKLKTPPVAQVYKGGEVFISRQFVVTRVLYTEPP